MTAQQIVDRVRALLKDDYKGYYRWSDAYMFDSITEATKKISEHRPASLWTTVAPSTTIITSISALGDTLQINDKYQEAVVNYTCHRCLSVDSEDAMNIERGSAYLSKFEYVLN